MEGNSKYSFACVCASNVNRSMEGHKILKKNGFNVSSYGTNEQIKMPGPQNRVNTYDFGATYEEILKDMISQGGTFYEEQGLLSMIEQDGLVKNKPERFASTFISTTRKYFNVIFTYKEEPIMKKVLDEFADNGNRMFRLCHIVNIETEDDREHAVMASHYTLDLAKAFEASNDITEDIESIIDSFNKNFGKLFSFHIVSY